MRSEGCLHLHPASPRSQSRGWGRFFGDFTRGMSPCLSLRKKESGQRDFWAEGLWVHVHPREETLEEIEDYLALSLGALCSEDRRTSYQLLCNKSFQNSVT